MRRLHEEGFTLLQHRLDKLLPRPPGEARALRRTGQTFFTTRTTTSSRTGAAAHRTFWEIMFVPFAVVAPLTTPAQSGFVGGQNRVRETRQRNGGNGRDAARSRPTSLGIDRTVTRPPRRMFLRMMILRRCGHKYGMSITPCDGVRGNTELPMSHSLPVPTFFECQKTRIFRLQVQVWVARPVAPH